MVVRSESVSQKRKKKIAREEATRTRLSSAPVHLKLVPTAITRGEVQQQLMHIADEMHEELERELWSSVCHRLGPADKVGLGWR